jgi:hypothetical protein
MRIEDPGTGSTSGAVAIEPVGVLLFGIKGRKARVNDLDVLYVCPESIIDSICTKRHYAAFDRRAKVFLDMTTLRCQLHLTASC